MHLSMIMITMTMTIMMMTELMPGQCIPAVRSEHSGSIERHKQNAVQDIMDIPFTCNFATWAPVGRRPLPSNTCFDHLCASVATDSHSHPTATLTHWLMSDLRLDSCVAWALRQPAFLASTYQGTSLTS